MKAIRFIFSVVLLVCYAGSRSAYAQDSAFTYQGRLSGDASAADARYEMTFTLYDAPTNGNVVGSQTVAPVAVTNGLFTATVDFGSSTFDGGARGLAICLTIFGSDMVPTTLTPRQQIPATPYAIRAATAGNLVSRANAPVQIQVNGVPALRIEPTIGAPNIIGGYAQNGTSNDVVGAFIGGGGMNDFSDGNHPNGVYASYGAIAGGFGNAVGDQAAFIGGGAENRIAQGAYTASIVGGHLNAIES